MKKRPCGMGALRVDEHRTTKQCECGVHYEHRRASAAELIGSQAAREPPVQLAPALPHVCTKCVAAFATAECLEAHLGGAPLMLAPRKAAPPARQVLAGQQPLGHFAAKRACGVSVIKRAPRLPLSASWRVAQPLERGRSGCARRCGLAAELLRARSSFFLSRGGRCRERAAPLPALPFSSFLNIVALRGVLT